MSICLARLLLQLSLAQLNELLFLLGSLGVAVDFSSSPSGGELGPHDDQIVDLPHRHALLGHHPLHGPDSGHAPLGDAAE
uniref:Secreted protein n=1 Tax=Cannabis sativa TaxID=3483 RepID=A0A803NTF2_CANSA